MDSLLVDSIDERIEALSAALLATENVWRGWSIDDPLPVVDDRPIRRVRAITALPRLRARPFMASHDLAWRVPARKWRQVVPFVEIVLAMARGESVVSYVDCCSGKGHLGRTLARVTGHSVELVERDEALCRAADELAVRVGAPARSRRADIMSHEFDASLGIDATLLALHACGDLHVRVLDRLRQRCARVAVIAPCCYCRTSTVPFTGLSWRARSSGLELSREDLSTATLGMAVARRSRRARLERREASRLGRRRFERAREYERLRAPFRRGLEVWLALDRGLWLREKGLDVDVGVFCSECASPRNIAIVARWPVSEGPSARAFAADGSGVHRPSP